MRRAAILAALGLAVAAGLGATARPADAFVSSASIDELTATLNLAGPFNRMTVSVSDGWVVHDPEDGVFDEVDSRFDWDSAHEGDQRVPAIGAFTIIVNGSTGNDELTVLADDTQIASSGLNGGEGEDVLTGSSANDTLNGGVDSDRLIAQTGDDIMNGGTGNDTLVWNDRNGSDVVNGDAGDDVLEVNGSAILGDAFLLEPNTDRVKLSRLNLGRETLDVSTERVQINGLGGGEFVREEGDVSGLTRLSVNGGGGADDLAGTEGSDVIRGGPGNDKLAGAAGDDRFVWDNGDGSDMVDGGAGRDDVEVNGDAAQGDIFTLLGTGDRIRLDRLNLAPFSIDVGSSETLHVNGSGGNDEFAVGDVGTVSVIAAGDAGNDALAGGRSADTLLGGSGDDTISGGAGRDVVSGDEGDDQIHVADGTAEVAFGGAGDDLALADVGLDILDGFETINGGPFVTPPPPPPVVAPPAEDMPRPIAPAPNVDPPGEFLTPPGSDGPPLRVTITGRRVTVHGSTAAIRLSCPMASSGSCTGSLVLRTTKRVKLAGRRTAVLELARARYTLAPGTSRALKLKLASLTRRAADLKGRVDAVAVASTATAGSAAQTTRRLTLALARKG